MREDGLLGDRLLIQRDFTQWLKIRWNIERIRRWAEYDEGRTESKRIQLKMIF